jgi:toxin ParE1/3/4
MTARAERDLEDIWLTIAAHDTRAATRIVRDIAAKLELLTIFPRMGTRRPDIRPGMRVMVRRPYLVLHAIYPDADDVAIDTVEIVRIVDGRRDLRRLF